MGDANALTKLSVHSTDESKSSFLASLLKRRSSINNGDSITDRNNEEYSDETANQNNSHRRRFSILSISSRRGSSGEIPLVEKEGDQSPQREKTIKDLKMLVEKVQPDIEKVQVFEKCMENIKNLSWLHSIRNVIEGQYITAVDEIPDLSDKRSFSAEKEANSYDKKNLGPSKIKLEKIKEQVKSWSKTFDNLSDEDLLSDDQKKIYNYISKIPEIVKKLYLGNKILEDTLSKFNEVVKLGEQSKDKTKRREIYDILEGTVVRIKNIYQNAQRNDHFEELLRELKKDYEKLEKLRSSLAI